MGRGTFGVNLGRTILTNGDFTAYVCDSAAMRPSSQITLGKLVVLGVQSLAGFVRRGMFIEADVDCAGSWSQRRPECDGTSRSSVSTHWLAYGPRESDSLEDDSLGGLHTSTLAQALYQAAAD